MTQKKSHYQTSPPEWEYQTTMAVAGVVQDFYVIPEGQLLVTLSKGFPAKGWHLAISAPPNQTVAMEMVERTVQQFFDLVKLPYVRLPFKGGAGIFHYHEKYW